MRGLCSAMEGKKMTVEKQRTCEDRVEAALESAIEDLTKLWEAYTDDDEDAILRT